MAVLRVMVVDDSCMYQQLLSDIINAHPGMQVVGVATNGKDAMDQIDSLKPDVITLDILMPQMDGIQTLMAIRQKCPQIRTIMVSSLTSEGSDAALDALTLGAHEYAAKPASIGGGGNIRSILGNDLIPKIEALCGIESGKPDPVAAPPRQRAAVSNIAGGRVSTNRTDRLRTGGHRSVYRWSGCVDKAVAAASR